MELRFAKAALPPNEYSRLMRAAEDMGRRAWPSWDDMPVRRIPERPASVVASPREPEEVLHPNSIKIYDFRREYVECRGGLFGQPGERGVALCCGDLIVDYTPYAHPK
jgi:hypothetical protein